MSTSSKSPEELARYRVSRAQTLNQQRAERDGANAAYHRAIADHVSNASQLREKRLAAEDVITLPSPAKAVVKRLRAGQTPGTRRAING